MKGIILGAGRANRLTPATKVVNKQLLPIYDKPMIYYPITTLISAGITDLLIVLSPYEQHLYQKLIGDGSEWGVRFSYKIQPKPNGITEAYIIAEEFLNGEPSCLILGDNIFYGDSIIDSIQQASSLKTDGHIYSYRVDNPECFGVLQSDAQGRVVDVIEKPKTFISNDVIVGLYIFNHHASTYAQQLKGPNRFEITELIRYYLKHHQLKVEKLGVDMEWIDAGTPESLLKASLMVATRESKFGIKIGCPEEAVWRRGLIDDNQLQRLAKPFSNSAYGQYLLKLLECKLSSIQD